MSWFKAWLGYGLGRAHVAEVEVPRHVRDELSVRRWEVIASFIASFIAGLFAPVAPHRRRPR